jgi:hypothetical protein
MKALAHSVVTLATLLMGSADRPYNETRAHHMVPLPGRLTLADRRQ